MNTFHSQQQHSRYNLYRIVLFAALFFLMATYSIIAKEKTLTLDSHFIYYDTDEVLRAPIENINVSAEDNIPIITVDGEKISATLDGFADGCWSCWIANSYWYKFYVPPTPVGNGISYEIEASSSTLDMTMSLYKGDINTLIEEDENCFPYYDAQLGVTNSTGEWYFVKVSATNGGAATGAKSGTYTIGVTTSPELPYRNLILDFRYNTGYLLTPKTVEYRFTTEEPGTYTIQTNGSLNTLINLYDVNGFVEQDDDDGDGANALITRSLAANTQYIVRMTASSYGSYSIVVNSPVKTLVVDSLSLSSSIIYCNETDWYKFKTDAAGSYIIKQNIEYEQGFWTVYVELYKSDRTTLIDQTNGNQIEQILSANTLYYIKLSSYVYRASAIVNLDYSVGVYTGTQVALTVNAPPANALIDFAGEMDWFVFQSGASGNYTIQTYGALNTYMSLYPCQSFGCLPLAEDDDSGTENNALISKDLNPYTWYFVKIKGYDSSLTGPYSIEVKSAAAAPTLSVSPTSISLDYSSGASGTFDITSNTSWSITDDASWLNVFPESGINNATITVTASSANTGTSPRTATVRINGTGVTSKTVTVTQAITPDIAKPVVTAFTVSATSSSLIVPVSNFTATDNIAVTGFKITETTDAPYASDGGWNTTAPASYTFVSEGTKTLYSWAKDASGNVSNFVSGTVIISDTDTVVVQVSDGPIRYNLSDDGEDWYKFKTSADGEHIIKAFQYTEMYIYESDGKTLISHQNTDEEIFKDLTLNLSANKWYYVKINTVFGSYDLCVIKGPIIVLQNKTKIDAALNMAGEGDWYSFDDWNNNADSFEDFTFQSYGNTDTYMTIYSQFEYRSFGEEASDDNNGIDNNAMISTTICFKYTRYYVRIGGSNPSITGPYSIVAEQKGYLSVSQSEISISYEFMAAATFEIISDSYWNITSNEDWLYVVPFGNREGYNNGILVQAKTANSGTSPRTATLTISGEFFPSKTITITQDDYLSKSLGNTEVYSLTTTTQNLTVVPVTFNEAGKIRGEIDSISIYHNGGTGNIMLGVYSDEAGLPKSQLGITAITPVNTFEGWQTVPLTSPATITPGQTVWLAWVFENNVGQRFTTETPGGAFSTATWSSGMPADFGISSVSGTKYSIYCTYTPVADLSPTYSEYLFEESGGTTVFDSNDSNDGIIMNTAARVKGVRGGGLEFTGSGYITLRHSFSENIQNEVSLSAWIKPSSIFNSPDNEIIITGGIDNYYALYIRPDFKGIIFQTNGTSNDWVLIENVNNLWDGNWHHIAVTYNGSQKIIYLDGVALLTVNATGKILWGFGYGPIIGAGLDGDYPMQFYKGLIDEVRIYNYALTNTQVGELYDLVDSKPDIVPAVVTAFSIPATSSSLIVPVGSFTATDNIAVTGFKITETPDAPNATDGGWTATAPASYTFNSEGTKTLYSWAKDSSGNVSNSVSRNVTVTLPDMSPTFSEYLFDESSGTTVIDSNDSIDGIIMNTVKRVDGVRGSGLEFTGAGYISLGQSFGENVQNEVTLSAWINPTLTTGNYQGIIMHGGPNTDSYALYIYPNAKEIGFKTSGTSNAWATVNNVSKLWDGNWHLLTATYNGSKKIIYLDNEAIINVDATGTIVSGLGYNLLIGAGRDEESPTLLYQGLIDEARIYNYALTNEQVGELYNLINPICLQHFHPVWEGTFGFEHMNINVTGAQLDGLNLETGDEIGVFDGNTCVGFGRVEQTIDQQNLLNIVVSQDDSSGNGYTSGNKVLYTVWDCSESKEYHVQNIKCFDNQQNLINCTTFATGTTTFALLSGYTVETQQIALYTGWNIMSIRVMPENENLKNILQPLIDDGKLNKVMDETGKVIEDWGYFGGWQNTIGGLKNTKGYKINVSSSASLEVAGVPMNFPFKIPLKAGWNIISWPSPNEQNGKAVFQTLIDESKLKKVMNEAGKIIEDWGFFGGWQNYIGNFKPGEGYKVNVTSDCILTIDENGIKSEEILPELLASIHFIPVFKGNGTDHMNINLLNLAESGFLEGDEIGIFDGNRCVGSAQISNISSLIDNQNSISIPVSASDDNESKNGYIEGNSIIVKLFRNGIENALTLHPINRSKVVFEKGESLFAMIDFITGLERFNTHGSTEITCYPNPFSDKLRFEFVSPKSVDARIIIYDMTGRMVKTIFDQPIEGGVNYESEFKPKSTINGIYFYKVIFGEMVYNGKVMFMKK